MSSITNIPTKQHLLDFLARKLNRNLTMYFENCQRCGLCAESCHYYRATHDPKMIPAYKAEQVRKLYRRRDGWSRKFFPWFTPDNGLDEESLEALGDVAFGSCTMCRRCTISCPMGIDIAMIIRAARGMLTLARKAPKGLQDTVDVHLRTGNNMAMTSEDFTETVKWMEEELQKEVGDPRAEIPIDKMGAANLWVLNPREVKFYPLLLQAQAKIFYAAGEDYTLSSRYWDVTNYALFSGDDDAARSIAGFVLAEADRLGIKTIVCTECGHGMRALKYFAPLWLKRTDFQIKAFVEVVAKYIEEGRIKLDSSVNRQRVTFHDPCNQARSGGFIEEPRFILRHSVSDFVELTPHGRDNWCCGGGGGALTMSEFRNRRLDVGRIKVEQIGVTDAKIVATSCHNCIDQISELSRHYRLGVQVKNTCELVADALVLPLPVDERGYLKDPSQWNRNIAQSLASKERVGELTKDHWQILEYVREYYNCYQTWPLPSRMTMDVGVDPRPLFPAGVEGPEVILKVAGLPNPGDHFYWDGRSLRDHQ